MKFKISIFPLFLIILLVSCSQYKYFPNTINAPLLKEKGEYQVYGGSNYGLEIESMKSFDLHTSYALTDHWVLQWNSQLHLAKAYQDTGMEEPFYDIENPFVAIFVAPAYVGYESTPQSQLYSESSLGFYQVWRDLIIELHAGIGLGRNNVSPIESMDWDIVNFYKLYAQADVGYRTKYVDVGLGVRESYVNLYRIAKKGETASRNLDFYIYDPFVFLGVGQEEFAKVYFKFGLTDFNDPTQYEIGILNSLWYSAGISWRFPRPSIYKF